MPLSERGRGARTACLRNAAAFLFLGAAALPGQRAAPWLEPTREEPSGTHYKTFRSAAAGADVSYLIYLPPGYGANPERRYPVLYWLHGGGGNQRTGGPFVALLDTAIRNGKAPEMIVVLVNGLPGSLFVNRPGGGQPVEDMIVRDLIPHIDATYRTVAARAGRAIEGFSMGGHGAAHLGFEYPELFCAVSNLAGAVLSAERFSRMENIWQGVFRGNREFFEAHHPFQLARRNAQRIRGRMLVRIVVGDADTGRGTLEANQNFHALLDGLKIEHEFTLVKGVKHSYQRLYEELGDGAFDFFRKAFPADARGPAMTAARGVWLAPWRSR
ncbi:MAG: alpha/beta hydrolase [Bryobacteraceae bacterium]